MDITQLNNDVIAHIMASFKMENVKNCYNFALTCTKFYSCLQKNKEKINEHFIRTIEKDGFGNFCNYYGNRFHSVNDQPSVIIKRDNDCSKYWYYHGVWHRDNNLPAITHNNGVKERKEWYRYGKQYYPDQ